MSDKSSSRQLDLELDFCASSSNTVSSLKFLQDVGHVMLDGFFGHLEPPINLFVAFTRRKLEHLAFTLGQILEFVGCDLNRLGSFRSYGFEL